MPTAAALTTRVAWRQRACAGHELFGLDVMLSADLRTARCLEVLLQIPPSQYASQQAVLRGGGGDGLTARCLGVNAGPAGAAFSV